MKILKGDEKHIAACLSIAKEMPQYFNERGIAMMTEDLKKHRLYVAVDFDEVLGFLTILHKNKQVAEISWMAVKPGHQRRRIGSALIDHVIKELRSEGIKLLVVKTLSEDVNYPPYEITRRFYKKKGFIHLETIDPYPEWEPGNPCAIYVKIL